MPIARIRTSAVVGVTGHPVTVEASLTSGTPGLHLAGLADAAIPETRDRVRAAVINSGLPWPNRHLMVSLYPVSLPKRGSGFDLPIAVAALAAARTADTAAFADVLLVGELGLDGRVRPVRGVLPAVLAAAQAGIPTVVVPAGNAAEASRVQGIRVVPVSTLRELISRQGSLIDDERSAAACGEPPEDLADHGSEAMTTPPLSIRTAPIAGDRPLDLADVPATDAARFALEVCAAGGHHLALSGPPGSGITMLAERLPTILPPLDDEAAIETAAVYSCAGLPAPVSWAFVAPHHSMTPTAMRGGAGGRSGIVHPGVVSLAHQGVLFLDEAPDFSAQALQTVQTAVQTGQVTVQRGGASVTLPARLQLVVSDRTCPCPARLVCGCPPLAIQRARARISGLLDVIEVQASTRAPIAEQAVALVGSAECSATVAERVRSARERASVRLAGSPWRTNAEVPATYLRRLPVPSDALAPVLDAANSGTLTARRLAQVMRVAWTLADLRGVDRPYRADCLEALALKTGDI